MKASLAVIALLVPLLCNATPTATPSWQASLQRQLTDLEAAFPGDIGVYAQSLQTGSVLSWRGAETWYLASMIKVPVAIELFSRIDRREMSLDDRLEVTRADYVDGAGQTNWQAPGTQVTLGWLLEQMLTVSDNTATDMLIRHLGIDSINVRAQSLRTAGLEPEALGPITPLVEVRRRAYGALHPRAQEFTGLDFIALRKVVDPAERVDAFAHKLGVGRNELQAPDLASAFEAYYATPYNSGRLDAFAGILAALAAGTALSPESSETLLKVMSRTRSGDRRIKAGLGEDYRFAHKTGTQLRRACDAGLISPAGETNAKPIAVVVACTRGTASPERAEQALADIGRALRSAGLLETTTGGPQAAAQ